MENPQEEKDGSPSDAEHQDSETGSQIVIEQAQQPGPEIGPTESASIVVAHLSDLHFGARFNQPLWKNVQRIVHKADADLVIVTGDLVNSPFRWTLKTARRELENLARGLDDHSSPPLRNLAIIPGNHDVRVMGIFPTALIKWLALIVGLVAYLVLAEKKAFSPPTDLLISGVLVSVLMVSKVVCFPTLTSVLSPYLLTKPTRWTDLGVTLYPFDSSSPGIFTWARGKIRNAEFVSAQEEATTTLLRTRRGRTFPNGNGTQYRIALLHHHPLPIPYDSSHEPLMVMENAGAFLSEIASQKIPLILHGHKHHQHFSRVAISASEDGQFETSVLAGGTPTAGKRAGRFGFNFNLISIEADGNARIIPYVSNGGTFDEKDPIWVHEPEVSARRTYTEATLKRGYGARSAVVVVDLNSDGDSRRVFECRGFKVGQGAHPLKEFPFPVTAESQVGRIERFHARGLWPDQLPGLRLRLDSLVTPRFQSGIIEYGRQLTHRDPAVNYSWTYHGINSYAMSNGQFRQMYGPDKAPIEATSVSLQYCPFAELVLIVNFPRDFQINGDPELIITDLISGLPAFAVSDRLRENLFYNREISVLFVRIPHPPLGLKYEVRWGLPDEPWPTDQIAALGTAAEVARWLLRRKAATQDPLRMLLLAVEAGARDYFHLGLPAQDPLHLDLMAYDEDARRLRIVAATYAKSDHRWKTELAYGEGIAGRAYKSKTTRLWVKQRALAEQTPFYFVPTDRETAVLTGKEISEEFVLSFPLAHPEEPNAVYAVLTLSSSKPSSELVNLTQKALTTEFDIFRQSVVEDCFEHIRKVMV